MKCYLNKIINIQNYIIKLSAITYIYYNDVNETVSIYIGEEKPIILLDSQGKIFNYFKNILDVDNFEEGA